MRNTTPASRRTPASGYVLRRSGGALGIALDLREHAPDLADGPHEIVARDVERGRDAHDGFGRVLRQDPAREQTIDDGARAGATPVDLDADEEAATAHVGHELTAQARELAHHPRAELGCALDQP